MNVTATEFKAKCLAMIDWVHKHREPITITKRGRILARLVPEDETVERPWLRLRNTVVEWHGDPFAAAVEDKDIEALT